MKALVTDNYIINHFAPSLEMIEAKENNVRCLLEKRLYLMNRKTLVNKIINVGTLTAYNNKCNKKAVNKLRYK